MGPWSIFGACLRSSKRFHSLSDLPVEQTERARVKLSTTCLGSDSLFLNSALSRVRVSVIWSSK
ncbi:hypothetical protein L484_012862 [Morus notabilis]|uniref:Uncharacterized protein n=1 Tax=Morus notabilis TaxID=981085 RepID=W9RFL1_9ROSA|nr:hypothetical protein L484_012862 [Morus notabilis]